MGIMKKIQNSVTRRTGMTRKEFLGTGLTAAAFTIIPSHVLGGRGTIALSDKINIAAIGVGSQGWSELNNDVFKNENIVALCNVNEVNLKRASERFPNAKTYIEWSQALEQKDIDALYIASNDQSHAFISIWAMNSGKYEYCQKPLDITVGEATKDVSSIPTSMIRQSQGTIMHYQKWVDACNNGGNTLSDFDYAGKLIEHNLLALAAYRVKKKLVFWDVAKLKATKCSEADKYIGKSSLLGSTYRQGWILNGKIKFIFYN